MPEHLHISPTILVIGIVIAFLIRFVLLMGGLLIMVKIQNFDFTWLPLIGSAILASALDLIPLVGHFIAVPVLYLCVWKSVRCDSYKDATFTVGISYAIVRSTTWILAAYTFNDFQPHAAQNNNYDFASAAPAPAAAVQPADPPAQTTSAPQNKTTTDISIRGFSRDATGAMVTFHYGTKDYTLSLGEGETISTRDGLTTVRFLEAGTNAITLDVGGQTEKFPVK